MKIFLMLILLLFAGLLLFMIWRTLRFSRDGGEDLPVLDVSGRVPDQEVADHLSRLIQCATVSNADPEKVDWGEFDRLRGTLEELYPAVHRVMEREIIGRNNLLFRWKGSDPQAKPIALLAHQDVVPVGDLSRWSRPPFSGEDDGEVIWGRGACDMKNHMAMVMDACERLIDEGYTPREDIYLCFGQNEEVGCLPEMTGADLIAATLRERGIRLDMVLDEGGAIVSGESLGIKQKFAAVGVTEKGFADFRITAHEKGGHSARPPKRTGLGKLGAAAVRLEKAKKPLRMIAPVREMLLRAVPYMSSFPLRFLTANMDMLEGLLLKALSTSPLMRAMVSTTYALTQAAGSEQDNVLPTEPWLGVNSRVLPGDDLQTAKAFLEKTIADPSLEVTCTKYHQVQNISPHDTRAFQLIEQLTGRYYPGTVVTPYEQFGGTDARQYYIVCDNVYRFMPVYLGSATDELGAHNYDEHVPKDVLGRGVCFIMDLIREYEGEE